MKDEKEARCKGTLIDGRVCGSNVFKFIVSKDKRELECAGCSNRVFING